MAKTILKQYRKTARKTVAKQNAEVTVRDHAWGSSFTGTKERLIMAGIPAEAFKGRIPKGGELKTEVTFANESRRREVSVTQDFRSREGGLLEVFVNHTMEERDSEPRVERAIQTLTESFAEHVRWLRWTLTESFAEHVRWLRWIGPPRLSGLLRVNAKRIERNAE